MSPTSDHWLTMVVSFAPVFVASISHSRSKLRNLESLAQLYLQEMRHRDFLIQYLRTMTIYY